MLYGVNKGDFRKLEDGLKHPGIVLSLSGGGYRAMLFHLGGLIRINELGLMPRLARVTSVSGGSIVAARLGVCWKELTFSAEGVAENFDRAVVQPILDTADHTLDVTATLIGRMKLGGASSHLAKRYDQLLYNGASLQDLPIDDAGPRFIILATNLESGRMWRFSRPYMRDWDTDPEPFPKLSVARAVAASTAFPPFLSPSAVTLSTGKVVYLADGGLYDNLGVESARHRFEVTLVSDGGAPYTARSRPAHTWTGRTLQAVAAIQVQVGRLRRRALVDDYRRGAQGALWTIATPLSHFPFVRDDLATDLTTHDLANLPTRLAKMPLAQREQLVNWGYVCADSALHSWWLNDTTTHAEVPFPH